jgi:uncharacterized membrane protein (UPF0127 family)
MWTTAWNETQDRLVLERVRHCTTALARGRGLTFRRAPADDEGLLLCWQRESRIDTAITMAFVFFSIGAVWLDGDGRVVDKRLARSFAPAYVPRAPARYVLEGQPAILDRVEIGDRLCFRG